MSLYRCLSTPLINVSNTPAHYLLDGGIVVSEGGLKEGSDGSSGWRGYALVLEALRIAPLDFVGKGYASQWLLCLKLQGGIFIAQADDS